MLKKTGEICPEVSLLLNSAKEEPRKTVRAEDKRSVFNANAENYQRQHGWANLRNESKYFLLFYWNFDAQSPDTAGYKMEICMKE